MVIRIQVLNYLPLPIVVYLQYRLLSPTSLPISYSLWWSWILGTSPFRYDWDSVKQMSLLNQGFLLICGEFEEQDLGLTAVSHGVTTLARMVSNSSISIYGLTMVFVYRRRVGHPSPHRAVHRSLRTSVCKKFDDWIKRAFS